MQLASLKPVAILTCNGFEGEKHLDLLLIEKLKLRGIVAESVIWQEEMDWKLYRAALIRSTWDYSLSRATRDSFLLVLKKIVDAGAQLFNSLPLVRWNSEKTYLRALSERGIDVIETLWLSKAHLPSLELELGNRGWTKCVIKPVISGSAMHTRCFVIGESSAVAREFAALEPEEWMHKR